MDLFSNIDAEFKIPDIKGLEYIPNYITKEEEQSLINTIDQQPWLNDLKRRVQHYGYKYDYTARKITQDLKIGNIPKWILPIAQKLYDDRVFDQLPDQVIINEYNSGQGISPHIDCIPCFGDTICSLSLLSPCIMDFQKEKDKHQILLEPRSLIVMKDEARYEWKHSIASRKSDNVNGIKIPRDRRVSMTFRTVVL